MNVKSILVVSALVFIANLSEAQDESKVTENRLRYLIGALAHDSMLGREAGKPEELKAAGFIASDFQQSGLKPALEDTGFLQPFAFGGIRYKEVKLVCNGKSYEHGVETGATAFSGNGYVSGTLVKMDCRWFDMSETDPNLPSESLEGKIVLMDQYCSGSGRWSRQKQVSVYTRIDEIVSRKASGIILFNSAPYARVEDLFHPDSVKRVISVPVVFVTNRVADNLKSALGQVVDITVQIDRRRKIAYNVAGFLDNGSSQTVVIGSHYDHVGAGNPADASTICNGADDNASGTAGVMELARWAASCNCLKYNYLFIAFSAEEKGLLGSYYWCSSPEFIRYKPVWMLNLDMIGRMGWSGHNYLAINGTASSPAWKRFTRNSESRPFRLINIKGAPALSDHYPFYRKGIPILYFDTGLHPEYHKPSDDAEKINYAGEAIILHYLRNVITEAEAIPVIKYRKINGWRMARSYISLLVFKK